jgi:hypothetical protein
MSSATLVSNGTKPKLPPGLLMTVHDFFSDVNWDDSPPAVQDVKRNAPPGSLVELSLLLPVHQFFAAVNWDGAAIAAVPTLAPVASSGTATVSFTLDDFSDLF